MQTLRTGIVAVVSAIITAGSANAAVLDFSTDGQRYAQNFRILERESGNVTANDTNGYLQVLGNTFSRITLVHDKTPADTTTRTTFGSGLQVDFDVCIPYANRSVGIYLIDASAATENSAYLALFNADYAGTGTSTDLLRFATGAVNSSVGAAGTLESGTATQVNTGYDAVSGSTSSVHVTLKYTIDASSHPTLDFTVGNASRSITYTSLTAFNQVEVGLRLSPYITAPDNYINIDNFSAAVPEPASLSLLGLGTGAMLLRRRKH